MENRGDFYARYYETVKAAPGVKKEGFLRGMDGLGEGEFIQSRRLIDMGLLYGEKRGRVDDALTRFTGTISSCIKGHGMGAGGGFCKSSCLQASNGNIEANRALGDEGKWKSPCSYDGPQRMAARYTAQGNLCTEAGRVSESLKTVIYIFL